MTTAQIVAGWKNGTVTSEAYVWKDGFVDWTPLLEVPELKSKLGPAPRTSRVTAAARTSNFGPSGTTPRPSQSKLHDMFGADLGDDVQTAPLPRTENKPQVEDDKALGARNESSVLFSLDALKAGGQTPQDASDAPEGSDLFGLGGANASGLGGLGSGGLGSGGGLGAPLGGLGSFGGPLGSNASELLTAPVQEPPKPIARPVAGSAELAPPPKGKGLVIGVALGVLLLAGGAFAVFGGGGDTEAKADAAAEQDNVAADSEREEMAAKLAAAEAEKKKLAEELAAAEAEKKKLAEEEAKKAEEEAKAKAEEEAKAKAEEEAKAKAAEAKKTDSKAGSGTAKAAAPAAAAPSGGGGSFDTGAAKAALASAAARASSCKKPGGPSGPGKAVVTFSTSGRATNAVVQGGAYGGTPVGGCVASIFRQATVPPFSGSAVTVAKSFSL